jgi:hypothetical protein
MNKQAGFITYLFVMVIAAALVLVGLYVWQTTHFGINFSSAPADYGTAPNTLLNFGGSSNTSSSGSNTSGPNSPYTGLLSLSSGSAESSYQPTDEYIEISNNSSSPVDISGWTLQNAFGNRPIQTTGNQAVHVAPEKVTIPLGTNFLDPSGNFAVGPIILAPGDTAIVTTGGPFVAYPFKISTSFRVNECAGYLNYTYPFDPSIDNICPAPQNEPGIDSITDVCYQYVKDIPTCYDPSVQDKANLKDNFQPNCIGYIETHFNYAACVQNHENDADFNKPTWRVFLGLSHELWHEPDDSIKLLDRQGRIVDEIDY